MARCGPHSCCLCLDLLKIDALQYLNESCGPVICVRCGSGCHLKCFIEECGTSCPDVTCLCRSCIRNIFPFNAVINHNDFLATVCLVPTRPNCLTQLNQGSKLDVITVDQDDHRLLNSRDIDPDSNLYTGLSSDSPYTTPDALSEGLKAVPLFHIMHLNCRFIE